MSMIQNRDGSFGELESIEDGLQKFQEMINQGEHPKALYIGTKPELDDIRIKSLTVEQIHPEPNTQDIEARLADLEEKFEAIEQPKSNLIHIHTREEIIQFSREEVKKLK